MRETHRSICLHCGFVEAYEVTVCGDSDGQDHPAPIEPDKCAFCIHAALLGIVVSRRIVDFGHQLERIRDIAARRKEANERFRKEREAKAAEDARTAAARAQEQKARRIAQEEEICKARKKDRDEVMARAARKLTTGSKGR